MVQSRSSHGRVTSGESVFESFRSSSSFKTNKTGSIEDPGLIPAAAIQRLWHGQAVAVTHDFSYNKTFLSTLLKRCGIVPACTATPARFNSSREKKKQKKFDSSLQCLISIYYKILRTNYLWVVRNQMHCKQFITLDNKEAALYMAFRG